MDMNSKAASEHFLAQVDRLVDWAALAPLIDAIGARSQSQVPPATVKMLLLARWYGMTEAALLEACQDRISFRRFLGLPLSDSPDDARLAEAYRRHATQAPAEAQRLTHAIEAQLLAKGFAITPGIWAEATVVPTALPPSNRAGGVETAFFQPGEIADLIRQGEAALVGGGAEMDSTNPPCNTGTGVLTPKLLQATLEWPWGATTELTSILNIGRLVGFSPVAVELTQYTYVSRKHAELMVCPEGVWVRDLRARNGTFVDDKRLPRGQGFLVEADARVRFGPDCVVLLKIKH